MVWYVRTGPSLHIFRSSSDVISGSSQMKCTILLIYKNVLHDQARIIRLKIGKAVGFEFRNFNI